MNELVVNELNFNEIMKLNKIADKIIDSQTLANLTFRKFIKDDKRIFLVLLKYINDNYIENKDLEASEKIKYIKHLIDLAKWNIKELRIIIKGVPECSKIVQTEIDLYKTGIKLCRKNLKPLK